MTDPYDSIKCLTQDCFKNSRIKHWVLFLRFSFADFELQKLFTSNRKLVFLFTRSNFLLQVY